MFQIGDTVVIWGEREAPQPHIGVVERVEAEYIVLSNGLLFEMDGRSSSGGRERIEVAQPEALAMFLWSLLERERFQRVGRLRRVIIACVRDMSPDDIEALYVYLRERVMPIVD